jgi:AcrR family transcriptional regulator
MDKEITMSSELDIKMRILLAAKKLFAIQGFNSTTVRQICDEAGANVALVSYHFGGKENVFKALFATFLPLDTMEEFVTRDLDPIEGVVAAIEGITRLRKRDPEMVALMQQEIAQMSPRIEVIREHAFPMWGKLRSVLEKGREEGLFHFRSVDHAFLFVLGSLFIHKQYEYFRPLFKEGAQTFEDIVGDTREFILRGLGYVDERGRTR